MSGVGNNVGGSTIFSNNTVTGGVNDVTVNNQVVEGDLEVRGTFDITITEIENNLLVDGNLQVGDPALGAPAKNLNVTGTTQIAGGLAVADIAQFNDDVTCGGNLDVQANVNIGFLADAPSGKRMKLSHSAGEVEFGMDASGNATITTTGGDNVLVNTRVIESSREPYEATFWVAPTGSNSTGTGSQSNPFATLSKALDIGMPLYATMCVHLTAGTYTEDINALPDFPSSVTILGEAFPRGQHEKNSDQFSTIWTGNFRLISGTSDSQFSVKHVQFNFASTKFINITVGNVRGPAIFESCRFSRQDVDEEVVLVLTSSSVGVYFTDCAFTKPSTTDLSLQPLVDCSGGFTSFAECWFLGRVSGVGILRCRGSVVLEDSALTNTVTTTTNASPLLVLDGSTAGRTLNVRECQFFPARGAILDYQKTVQGTIYFQNVLVSYTLPVMGATTYLIMNTGATAVIPIQIINSSLGFSNLSNVASYNRSKIIDPVYFSTLSSQKNVMQNSDFADFNIFNVNTITGTSNTPLTVESSGTGSVIVKTGGTDRLTVTSAGVPTFSTLPECSIAATTANQLTNKTYVDSATVASATNVATTASSVNATVFPTFVSASSGSNPVNVSVDLTYNPSTKSLTGVNTMSGTADTALTVASQGSLGSLALRTNGVDRVTIDGGGTTEISDDLIVNGNFSALSRAPYSSSFYVSKEGNDTTGTGSQTNPFLTIQNAILQGQLLENDFTIFVSSGTYVENLEWGTATLVAINIIGYEYDISFFGMGGTLGNMPVTIEGSISTTSGLSNTRRMTLQNVTVNLPSGSNIFTNSSGYRFVMANCHVVSNFEDNLPLVSSVHGGTMIFYQTTFTKVNTNDSTTPTFSFTSATVYFHICRVLARTSSSICSSAGFVFVTNCDFGNVTSSTGASSPLFRLTGNTANRPFDANSSVFRCNTLGGFMISERNTNPVNVFLNNCTIQVNLALTSGTDYVIKNTGSAQVALYISGTQYEQTTGAILQSPNIVGNTGSGSVVYGPTSMIGPVDFGNVSLSNVSTMNTSGVATFAVPPECAAAPTTANQLTNKTYVDDKTYVAQLTATGGDVVSDYYVNGRKYRCHQFTSTGAYTFSVSAVLSNPAIDFIIIGGGGSGGTGSQNIGGQNEGGGGGGGGTLFSAYNVFLNAVPPFTITGNVGSGGSNANGNSSTIVVNGVTFTAHGGAKGGNTSIVGNNGATSFTNSLLNPYSGSFGASGGGGGGGSAGGGSGGGTNYFGVTSFGFDVFGGGRSGGDGAARAGAGGGGIASVGANAGTDTGGNGGAGIGIQFCPTLRFVCGGGGGGGQNVGGTGTSGGGNGGVGAGIGQTGFAGAANTGGGGGGSVGPIGPGAGGAGGSGIVMIRYPIS